MNSGTKERYKYKENITSKLVTKRTDAEERKS